MSDSLASSGRDVSSETLRSIWDILAGDINKSGRDYLAALKLLEAMAVSLGSTLSWQSAARAMGYWRSSSDREVDFVVPQVTDLETERLPVEVKGDNPAGLLGARQAIRQRFSNGIVLSRTVLDLRSDIAVLPVWLFLAGLREEPHRTINLG